MRLELDVTDHIDEIVKDGVYETLPENPEYTAIIDVNFHHDSDDTGKEWYEVDDFHVVSVTAEGVEYEIDQYKAEEELIDTVLEEWLEAKEADAIDEDYYRADYFYSYKKDEDWA